MTRRNALVLAGFTSVMLAAARPAFADVYYVTYTGTATGTDTNGVFGAAGATLTNAAFTSVYTYNVAQFGNAAVIYQPAYAYVYGGTLYNETDPLIAATVTINSKIFYQSPSYVGQEYVGGGTGTPYIEDDAYSSATNYLSNYGNVSGSTTLSFTAAQSFTFLPGQSHGGFLYNGENLAFTDTYVSVTDGPPTAVSEPGSLALLGGLASIFALAVGGWRAAGNRHGVARDGCVFA